MRYLHFVNFGQKIGRLFEEVIISNTIMCTSHQLYYLAPSREMLDINNTKHRVYRNT